MLVQLRKAYKFYEGNLKKYRDFCSDKEKEKCHKLFIYHKNKEDF